MASAMSDVQSKRKYDMMNYNLQDGYRAQRKSKILLLLVPTNLKTGTSTNIEIITSYLVQKVTTLVQYKLQT